jgi:hypothetical protein
MSRRGHVLVPFWVAFALAWFTFSVKVVGLHSPHSLEDDDVYLIPGASDDDDSSSDESMHVGDKKSEVGDLVENSVVDEDGIDSQLAEQAPKSGPASSLHEDENEEDFEEADAALADIRHGVVLLGKHLQSLRMSTARQLHFALQSAGRHASKQREKVKHVLDTFERQVVPLRQDAYELDLGTKHMVNAALQKVHHASSSTVKRRARKQTKDAKKIARKAKRVKATLDNMSVRTAEMKQKAAGYKSTVKNLTHELASMLSAQNKQPQHSMLLTTALGEAHDAKTVAMRTTTKCPAIAGDVKALEAKKKKLLMQVNSLNDKKKKLAMVARKLQNHVKGKKPHVLPGPCNSCPQCEKLKWYLEEEGKLKQKYRESKLNGSPNSEQIGAKVNQLVNNANALTKKLWTHKSANEGTERKLKEALASMKKCEKARRKSAELKKKAKKTPEPKKKAKLLKHAAKQEKVAKKAADDEEEFVLDIFSEGALSSSVAKLIVNPMAEDIN